MKISVVTPTLALDDFLTEARQSVARQDCDCEIEHLIAVDDHYVVLPPDAMTGRVVTRFLHNGQAKGPGGARNSALDHATGAIIFFLDADDIWSADYIRRIVAVYAAQPAVDCVSVAGLSFGEAIQRPRLTIPSLPNGIIARATVAWNPIGGPSGFSYRRTAATGAIRFKDAIYFQDILFYLDLLRQGAVFWRENSVRYWYRRSPGQLISTRAVDKVRASRMLVEQSIATWRDAGLTRWEARVAHVQIQRLSANRERRRDWRHTLLLVAMAPRWALAQLRRYMENRHLTRSRP